jgi:hypothetical protein
MPKFQVAHIHRSGVDLIIIPLGRNFGNRSRDDQEAVIDQLQARAENARLAGSVVPVWDGGGGRMAFIAPRNLHPFLRSISLADVRRNVNRELYW